jgi:hypothetical protein
MRVSWVCLHCGTTPVDSSTCGPNGGFLPSLGCLISWSPRQGAALAIWLTIVEQLTKGEADLARRARSGRFSSSTWEAELWLWRLTPTGLLSFSSPTICQYNHYDYIYMSQLLGGMSGCYKWLPSGQSEIWVSFLPAWAQDHGMKGTRGQFLISY